MANTTTIVGGVFKGKRIQTGRGHRIRPTQSRIREAIFNLLGDVSGADILDLYAGAGTLGFEALSRGAESVTLVERDPGAVKLLESNGVMFENGRVNIVKDDCIRFLERTKRFYDIILADPPYGKGDLTDLKKKALKRLEAGGTLVLETSARQSLRDMDGDMRRYGDTYVLLFRKGR